MNIILNLKPNILLHYELIFPTYIESKQTKRVSHAKNHFSLSEVWLMKSDFSNTSDLTHTRTHLGHILKPGDTVLAFSFSTANINLSQVLERDLTRIIDSISDVVIIKKYYGDSHKRHNKRQWQLKRLAKDEMETSMDNTHRKNNGTYLIPICFSQYEYCSLLMSKMNYLYYAYR